MDDTAASMIKVLDRTKHLMKECNLSMEQIRVTTPETQLQAILSGIEEAIKYVIQMRRYP